MLVCRNYMCTEVTAAERASPAVGVIPVVGDHLLGRRSAGGGEGVPCRRSDPEGDHRLGRRSTAPCAKFGHLDEAISQSQSGRTLDEAEPLHRLDERSGGW